MENKNKGVNMQYRHGDLLIVKVDGIPEGTSKIKSKILAEGEATGHSHTLTEGQLYEKDGQLWFSSSKPTSVSHQEHAKIDIPSGDYKVIRQREYQPKEAPRQVRD